MHAALVLAARCNTAEWSASECMKDRAPHVASALLPQGGLPGSWGVRITQTPEWPRRKPTHMRTDPDMVHRSRRQHHC